MTTFLVTITDDNMRPIRSIKVDAPTAFDARLIALKQCGKNMRLGAVRVAQ